MTQANKELPKWLAVTADGVAVTLKYPIEVDGIKNDTLFMRAPCVRDLRVANAAANGDDDKREMAMFSSLTQVGEADLLGLKLTDHARLQAGYFRLVNDE
ncbi:phage tail assembly protein [Pseudomonas vancouverensis]|uniref:Phage tail assembly protein n=1 Tax=Pseudomonas vancouverensis TaxID=95300 RepID=A0A1H2N8H7_PSEVA|nr:phage tail assembly protein [Pseudomonas vancouverensis]KAB0494024.1 phage tail assembly protein [Pseudomonas vancouverensis]TDB61461.1 phage tail assembly protein [Pseudomonas vancouverensis]SDV01770.1 Phage tail assembly chaperone protein, E, or 41 or 14 [Pseudomonas vancouverensis]